MPLYSYHCNCCGDNFECFLKVSDRDLQVNYPCPLCGGDKVTRNISKATFKVNGYSEANGYARKN